jgi:hypothetical protein
MGKERKKMKEISLKLKGMLAERCKLKVERGIVKRFAL